MKKIITALLLFSLACALFSCSADRGREYSVEDYRTTMEYHEDFKVLQLTDLHLGIESDLKLQLEVVEKSILKELPDLVILTGDNFMYGNKAIVKALIETLNFACKTSTNERGRLTKFTLTFGNHDNQGDYSRYFINEVINQYVAPDGEEIALGKYAAFRDFEDDALFGNANFYIDLVDDREKSLDTVDVKYRIHIIDSNSYHYLGGKNYGYDVIHEDQLLHTGKVYESATLDKNYIGLAFFHIPFEEFDKVRLEYLENGDKSNLGTGEFLEYISAPYENNGSYAKLREANICAFFVGHDHINYGDFIYTPENASRGEAIFSYGVKTTNQLYHERDMMGYKTITLKDISKEEFVSVANINENFKNLTGGYDYYENK